MNVLGGIMTMGMIWNAKNVLILVIYANQKMNVYLVEVMILELINSNVNANLIISITEKNVKNVMINALNAKIRLITVHLVKIL